MPRAEIAQGKIFANKWLAAIGAASFSIFVWHQVVLAMIRYSFTNNLTEATPLLAFVAITVVLSVISYKYVEKMKKTKGVWSFIALLFVLTTAGSLYIYANAGVVRDVPELEVVKGKVHRGMWAEYCDRGYKYEMEEGYAEKNERLKAVYPNNYIDMVLQPDGKVRVFSDDGHFISQDCRHLTRAEAQYYASLIEWERFYQ